MATWFSEMSQSAVPFLFIPFKPLQRLSLNHLPDDICQVFEGSGLKALGGDTGIVPKSANILEAL